MAHLHLKIISANKGQEPIEIGFLQPGGRGSTDSMVFFDMYIVHNSGPLPKFMKVIITTRTGRIPLYEFASNTTTVVGSANSVAGTAVAAVLFKNTPAYNVTPPNANGAQTFGIGNPIVFDIFGNRTQTPTIRKPLRLRAVGDASAKNFNFFNTAAAHVAGIAALMLQAKGGPKSLTPQQVTQYLERSAMDLDYPFTPGFDVIFDDTTGSGFVDALAALDLVTATKAPTKNRL
jgi:hypothetical protein